MPLLLTVSVDPQTACLNSSSQLLDLVHLLLAAEGLHSTSFRNDSSECQQSMKREYN